MKNNRKTEKQKRICDGCESLVRVIERDREHSSYLPNYAIICKHDFTNDSFENPRWKEWINSPGGSDEDELKYTLISARPVNAKCERSSMHDALARLTKL